MLNVMTINVYLSTGFRESPRYGFLAPNTPVSILPRNESWKYVRSADAAELGLCDADVEHLQRSGFGTREAGSGRSIR
jgi:hypothetical protein